MSKFTGQVKWFSRDRGLGFIKKITHNNVYTDGDKDVFVHYTGLDTLDTIYKTLYDGEYVEYIEKTLDDGRIVADKVKGILGGELMCEHVSKKKRKTELDQNHEHVNEH